MLSEFFNSIEILRSYIDYLEFRVADETRRIWINPRGVRCIAFHAPAHSLISAVKLGYFDAILIGSFMTAELHGVGLYPHFTPIVAKLAGASGVKTFREWRRFRRRYFRRNPVGYLEWHAAQHVDRIADIARLWADRLHVKRPLKVIYRKYLGDPIG